MGRLSWYDMQIHPGAIKADARYGTYSVMPADHDGLFQASIIFGPFGWGRLGLGRYPNQEACKDACERDLAKRKRREKTLQWEDYRGEPNAKLLIGVDTKRGDYMVY